MVVPREIVDRAEGRDRERGEPAALAPTREVRAREVRDELKSTSSSAGVSVAGVGSVNLPLGTSGASLVKVGEQTITDSEFYGRFFALMQTFIR